MNQGSHTLPGNAALERGTADLPGGTGIARRIGEDFAILKCDANLFLQVLGEILATLNGLAVGEAVVTGR